MTILNLKEFRIFLIISDGPSLNHRWPGMGAMGLQWPSTGAPLNVMTIGELHWSLITGTFRPRFQAPSVSPQLRENVALKASQPLVEKIFD